LHNGKSYGADVSSVDLNVALKSPDSYGNIC